MKVLIVEDEIRIREGITKLLGKLGDTIEVLGEAGDGEEGIELCERLHPEVIITDVKMPNKDGLQMLQELHDAGVMPKSIVLSAYSEFEYARRAMKLGVTEYLLKPISLGDFSQALDHIRAQLEEERRRKPEQVGTIEQVFRDVLEGRMQIDADSSSYLARNYHLDSNAPMAILCVYLGNEYLSKLEECRKQMTHALSLYAGLQFVCLENEYRRLLVIPMYHYEDGRDLERWLQYQILGAMSAQMALGFAEAASLKDLPEALGHLLPYMDWNISFENHVIIAYPQITKVQTSICVYPIDVENRMKVAICASDDAGIHATMEDFIRTFRSGAVFDPRELKECYVRFLWAIIEIGKEIGNQQIIDLKQQALLEKIMNSKTAAELEQICSEIEGLLITQQEDVTTHLTVKRALGMIYEYYNTGITLDEIAARMNITPEYLGTQFHKETGVKFSTYIKNYRMSKAKELLLGTNLKLYEIAERVGYSDPKYFSKVFKESSGMLPAEYRKTKK